MLIDSGVCPGVGSDLESDLAEVETLSVGEEFDREVNLRATAVRDDGAGRGEFEVAGEKVCVAMSLDDPLDSQSGRRRVERGKSRRRAWGRLRPRALLSRHR